MIASLCLILLNVFEVEFRLASLYENSGTHPFRDTDFQSTAQSFNSCFVMEKNTVNLKMFLSRQSKHYHPGDVVSGECVLRLSDHVKLRCISIEFQGESWTYWEETALYTLSHKNAEIYFHKKTTLFGSRKYKEIAHQPSVTIAIKRFLSTTFFGGTTRIQGNTLPIFSNGIERIRIGIRD